MRLAAVVAQDGHTVVGLPDGPEIHIWDTGGGTPKVVENPGFTATSARRMATLRAMLQESVEAVCTPPLGFCPHSHREAVRQGVRFITVDAGITVDALREQGEAMAARVVGQLTPELLAEPHHHHHGHEHGA